MQFLLPNHAMQTTAAPTAVTTGTSIKTMLQVKPLAPLFVVEWGYFFDQSPTDIKVELVETGTVFATVTASAEADITKYGIVADGVATGAINMTLSTTGTGYTSSGEGSITAIRNLDGPQISSLKSFIKQFPLGERPMIQIANAGRIRVTAAAAVNMLCYMILSTTR
jgi:hypothetical protein